MLLAYLSGPLGLSNTSLGLVSTIYILSAALVQPLFGHLADRVGPRWVVAGGVLWMAFFFSLAVIAPGTLALILLVTASLGSGAFHPAGTMQATLRGRSHYAGKETTATAYFFVFGQLGLFFGPMLGGPSAGPLRSWRAALADGSGYPGRFKRSTTDSTRWLNSVKSRTPLLRW